ncbi:MAG TPA: hypothetical protein VGO72_00210 [Herminiimonas sp.]|nr:hypothetical protein [Herminiimonas sp.]
MLNVNDVERYRRTMVMLYGAETVRQAEALLAMALCFCMPDLKDEVS